VADRNLLQGQITILALGLIFSACQAQSDEEEAHPVNSSSIYNDSYDQSVKALAAKHFGTGLEAPTFRSQSTERLNQLIGEIKKQTPIKGVQRSVTGADYDVILQPGHYMRPPGKLGTSGQHVSERALVAFIVGPMADQLRASGLNVLVIPADPDIQGTLSARVFLAVHADGNATPCSGKASLGYSKGTSPLAMHAVGYSLSRAMGYAYRDFHKDNYTVNESDYYMFRRVKADQLSGIVEIGELTCTTKEDLMITSSTGIATNLAKALQFVVGK
jgi:hypothetical protein